MVGTQRLDRGSIRGALGGRIAQSIGNDLLRAAASIHVDVRRMLGRGKHWNLERPVERHWGRRAGERDLPEVIVATFRFRRA